MHNALRGLALLILLFSAGFARATLLSTGSATDTTNNATQLTLSLPATLQVGDLLIAQIAYRNTGATLSAPNARWTLLQNTVNGTFIRQQVYVRTVVAADVAGASETWSVSGGDTRMAGGLSGWRSSIDGIYPDIEQSQGNTGLTSGGGNDLSAPAITTANAGQLLRLFGVSYGNGFAVTPPGLSEYYRPESGAGPNGASLLGVGRSISLPGSTGADSVSANGSGRYIAHSVFLYEPVSIAPRLSWWLDESAWNGSTGEILDQSGNGLHGTSYNGASTAISNPVPALPTDSSNMGTCRYGVFNTTAGQTRYAQIADNSLLDLTSFTLSLWVYPTSYPGSDLMSILSKDENYEFHLKPNGRINWWWTDSGGARQFDSDSAVPLNAWTHIAIHFDDTGNTQRIYINGLPDASASFTGTPTRNNDPFQIGQDQGLAGRNFRGNLDEVRVHSGALSDAQIAALAAERHPCAGGGSPHHLEFLHDGSALTCQPETITLRACADAGCSSLYTGSVSAALTPSGWVGGDSLTFSGGSTTAQLRHTTAEAVILGSGVVTPAPTSASVCNSATSGSCRLDFADSGFILDVPNLLAAKPTAATISAVRKSDDALQCVPAFANVTRSVSFTSDYNNPSSGAQPVVINGSEVRATPVSLSLNFDATGTAPLIVRYDDAGEMRLSARYLGSTGSVDEGLVLDNTDTDDLFVSKPYGLLLQTDTDSGCTADINCPLYPGNLRAGDPFSLRIKAVAWQSDGEALTAAALADNALTPNFQLSDIALASQVMAPAGGSAGTLGSASYSHALGNQTTLSQSISEVGVFQLTATPTIGYFGETVSGGASGLVGRFAPDHFDVQISQYEPAECVPGGGAPALFVYAGLNEADPNLVKIGQPFLFAGSVEARNAADIVTQNYDVGLGFSRLEGAAASIDDYVGDPPTPPSAAVDGVALVANTLSFANGVSAITPSGSPTYRFNAPRDAYEVSLIAGIADADGVTGSSAQTMAINFRLGQARIGNAHGSELQDLALPFTAAYFNGSGYVPNPLDSCTDFPAVNLGAYQRTDTGNGTPALVNAAYVVAGGRGNYVLVKPGPGSSGSMLLTYATPAWLKFDWDGNGVLDDASGLATFGIYKGAPPLIFRRESYR